MSRPDNAARAALRRAVARAIAEGAPIYREIQPARALGDCDRCGAPASAPERGNLCTNWCAACMALPAEDSEPCEECGALSLPAFDGVCRDCADERARVSSPIYHARSEE